MPYDAEISTKDALLRAAQAVRERGHAKRLYFTGEGGPICTMAAIQLGNGGQDMLWDCRDDTPAHRAVRAELGHSTSYDICDWNNQSSITADDVIAMFERAAAKVS